VVLVRDGRVGAMDAVESWAAMIDIYSRFAPFALVQVSFSFSIISLPVLVARIYFFSALKAFISSDNHFFVANKASRLPSFPQ
jgi:hypothetical protein